MHLCGCNGNGQSSAQLQVGASILAKDFPRGDFGLADQGDSPREDYYRRQNFSERDALRLTDPKIFCAQKTLKILGFVKQGPSSATMPHDEAAAFCQGAK